MAGLVPIIIAEGVKITVDVVKAFKDYSISYEKEVTERERIRATLEVCLREIEVKSSLVRQALEHSHTERMKLYDCMQIALHKSVEMGDTAMFGQITHTLIVIYDKAPQLSDLSNALPQSGSRRLTQDE